MSSNNYQVTDILKDETTLALPMKDIDNALYCFGKDLPLIVNSNKDQKQRLYPRFNPIKSDQYGQVGVYYTPSEFWKDMSWHFNCCALVWGFFFFFGVFETVNNDGFWPYILIVVCIVLYFGIWKWKQSKEFTLLRIFTHQNMIALKGKYGEPISNLRAQYFDINQVRLTLSKYYTQVRKSDDGDVWYEYFWHVTFEFEPHVLSGFKGKKLVDQKEEVDPNEGCPEDIQDEFDDLKNESIAAMLGQPVMFVNDMARANPKHLRTSERWRVVILQPQPQQQQPMQQQMQQQPMQGNFQMQPTQQIQGLMNQQQQPMQGQGQVVVPITESNEQKELENVIQSVVSN